MNDEVRKLIEQIKQGDITADEVISKLGLSESTIDDLREFSEQYVALHLASTSGDSCRLLKYLTFMLNIAAFLARYCEALALYFVFGSNSWSAYLANRTHTHNAQS